MKKNSKDPWRMVGLTSMLGLEIFAFIFGGIWLGRFLDAHYGTAPICIAVGSIGGMLIGIASAIFTLINFIKD
ncbi:AtpZ/AtpI family protein [Scopulibacillus cellulosilyticus]|uniref:AtpZ/AtpI family protein n=1 Tax=Scopulibacillus cellulosilyticus TaxID=2665665 RepID=A0ABW2PR32_9BACL